MVERLPSSGALAVSCCRTSGFLPSSSDSSPYIAPGAIERVFTPMGSLYFVLQAILANSKPLKSILANQGAAPLSRIEPMRIGADTCLRHDVSPLFPGSGVWSSDGVTSVQKHGRWFNSCCKIDLCIKTYIEAPCLGRNV